MLHMYWSVKSSEKYKISLLQNKLSWTHHICASRKGVFWSVLELLQEDMNCCSVLLFCTCYHVGQIHGSVECHFCIQVMIYWSLSLSHNHLAQNLVYVHICPLVAHLYLGLVYAGLYELWPSLNFYISYVCMEDLIYYFYRSIESSGFAQCDAFSMKKSEFVKLFKLYWYIYIYIC